jgi:transcriptional regulator with PAS, ATPase and Fis domain
MTTPLIGISKSIIKINELIKHVANTGLNVLITGETGVGKEIVAQNLYNESTRATKNFVKLNCAALPETLFESELFGYEKGAFTGADKNRLGKFQTADKGVLFLDEIGDMPILLQSKILHVLQSGEFSPLGSDQEFQSDVWVIAATNQDLEEKIKNKTFREDLFYRLNIINIPIPPLRKRKEDIPSLIEYFYRSNQLNFPLSQCCMPDSQTLTRLCDYPWPGNVRQLKNCIKMQLVYNSWEKILEELPREYPETNLTIQKEGQSQGAKLVAKNSTRIISQFIDISTSSDKLFEDISLKKIKKLASGRVEKEVIAFVLEKVGWNRFHAAEILKISYKALLYKMKEFEVHPLTSKINSQTIRNEKADLHVMGYECSEASYGKED